MVFTRSGREVVPSSGRFRSSPSTGLSLLPERLLKEGTPQQTSLVLWRHDYFLSHHPSTLHRPFHVLFLQAHTPFRSKCVTKIGTFWCSQSYQKFRNKSTRQPVRWFRIMVSVSIQLRGARSLLLAEIHTMQGNVALLPTVTSFIPSLPAREGLRISIHSWQNPEMSRYILSLKRPTDSVVFEARLFIDGKIAGCK